MTSAIDKQLEKKQEALAADKRLDKAISPLSKAGKMKYLVALLVALPLFVYLVVDKFNNAEVDLVQKIEAEEIFDFQPLVQTEPVVPVPVTAIKTEAPAPGETEPVKTILTTQTLALGESDPFFREQLSAVLDSDFFSSWGKKSESVRKATLVLDNLAQGHISKVLANSFVLEKKFSVVFLEDEAFGDTQRSVYRLDPAGYHRYDSVVKVITELEVEALVQAYLALEPLFKTAYKELGYPTGNMSTVILNALAQVRAASVSNEDIKLVRPGVMYKFYDPKLEAMSSLEKQLLRMGPENARRLQVKAQSLESALEQVLIAD